MNFKNNPKAKGELTEQIVITRLMMLGFNILRPIGDNKPYDCVIDLGDRMIKIQIKTARKLPDGGIFLVTKRLRINRNKNIISNYSPAEVDFFVYFLCETNEFFVLKNKDISRHGITIRSIVTKFHKNNSNNKSKYFLSEDSFNSDSISSVL